MVNPGNLINGLGKLVPANKKAEYYKDASKAMDAMNKVTGGSGGGSFGIQGGDLTAEEKALGWTEADLADGSSAKPEKPISKWNNDDAGTDDLDVYAEDYSNPEPIPDNTRKPGEVSSGTSFANDSADSNIRLGTTFADDASASVVRQHAKNKIKIPKEYKRNVLHKFASYTYHIELFVLSVTDYNSFIEDKKFVAEDLPGRLLIKSGGGNQKNRNKYFQLDYFIDNLQIDSVISPTAGNNGATNTGVSFTITEPYGMTLLNALVMACKEFGGFNYTNQPYLLKVTFKGYDKDGVLIQDNSVESTRYIPIKIKKFQFSASNEGTVYEVEAVPYHSIGLENTKATVKSDVRVDATTVGNFFTSDVTTLTSFKKQITGPMGNPEGSVIDQREEIVQGGLAGYFNLIEKEHVKQGTKLFADEYKFSIDPDIAQSNIILQNVVETRKIKNENDPRKKALGQFLQNFNYNETTQHFSVRAGTNIIQLIHNIIRTSTFMTNQVKADNLQLSPDKQYSNYKENEDTPINFYRIVPKITLLDKWDTKRNCFARRIEYVVKKYNMYGKDFENFGQAPITEIVKEYKYYYTGQNDDILNFDIDFNTAYFQKNLYQIAERAKKTPTQKSNYDPSDFAAGNLAKTDANAVSRIAPFIKESTIDIGSSKGVSDPRVDPRSLLVDNFMQEVFNTSADLLELTLEIIGDPAFIQQQDLRTVEYMTYEAASYFDDASLNPDKEWHLQLSFRNPIDIDTDTGLYNGFGHDEEGKAEVTAPTMNGIYKAVEVASKFADGKFTQSLKCIRERGKQVTDFVDKGEANKRVENVKDINKSVDLQIKKTPDPKLRLSPGALGGKLPGIPLPDDFDKTITGSNAVQNAIDKAGGLGKAFPKMDVNSIGDGVEAVTGGWEPPASAITKAKKASNALLASARKIAT